MTRTPFAATELSPAEEELRREVRAFLAAESA